MDTSDWITAIIAIVSLIVSVTVAIRDFNRDKRRISILLSLVNRPFILFPEGFASLRLKVTVVNNGFRPIAIKNIWLRLSNGEIYDQRYFESEDDLPISLQDGNDVDAWFDIREARKWLIEQQKKSLNPGLKFSQAIAIDSEVKEYKKKLPKHIAWQLSQQDKMDEAINSPKSLNNLIAAIEERLNKKDIDKQK